MSKLKQLLEVAKYLAIPGMREHAPALGDALAEFFAEALAEYDDEELSCDLTNTTPLAMHIEDIMTSYDDLMTIATTHADAISYLYELVETQRATRAKFGA